MSSRTITHAKESLLRELDKNFQRYYRTDLREVINELRVHFVDINPEPAPDELIRAIDQSKILNFTDAPPFLELRDTVHRVRQGQFGFCVACKKRISSQVLEREPNVKLCRNCERRVARVRLL